jgi:hypothetical protein
MRTGANRRRLAALTGSGSQVGSQRAATQGDARPRAATEAAGERHTGPRQATPSDSWSVHGMQEARGSSPLSSTAVQRNISNIEPMTDTARRGN